VIREARRMSKELTAQRELADRAEASRFTELHGFLAEELARLASRTDAGTGALEARIERLEADMKQRLTESERTLAAYVGEVDDKLDRVLPPRPGT
jgi:hypothetical protein